jgi:hypothetical protein
MKRALLFLLIFTILFSLLACSSTTSRVAYSETGTAKRLAKDYNSDWGVEAINFVRLDSVAREIKIAVLDTGNNTEDSHIDSTINISDSFSDRDNVEHGTIITSKILDLCPTVRIIPIKVLESDDDLTVDNLAKGIEKAVELEADIINVSLGLLEQSEDLHSVVRYAAEKQIFVIASAGNERGFVNYPGFFPSVISVLARDINNFDLYTNNFSSEKKSFSLPGEHILHNGEYYTGTSIACTFMTSVIHNYLARGFSYEEINVLLLDSCIYPTKYSYGLTQYKGD